jgi:hypothetical protein
LRQYFISLPASIHLLSISFIHPFTLRALKRRTYNCLLRKNVHGYMTGLAPRPRFFFVFPSVITSISIPRYTVCLYSIYYIVATCQRLCSDFVSPMPVVIDTSIMAYFVRFWAGIYHTWPHFNYH